MGGDIIVGPPPGSTQGPAEDNLQIGIDTKITADPRAEDVGVIIVLDSL